MRKSKLFNGTIAIFAIAMITTFGSCKKDEVEEPPSKTDLLTSSGWILKSFVLSTSTGDLDLYDLFLDACSKDDIFKFQTDHTVLIDEGATKCDPSDPQTSPGGTWEFINNNTEIIIDGDTMDVILLNSTDFKIELSEYDSLTQEISTSKLGFKH